MKQVSLILWFLISVHLLKHHTWAGSCAWYLNILSFRVFTETFIW